MNPKATARTKACSSFALSSLHAMMRDARQLVDADNTARDVARKQCNFRHRLHEKQRKPRVACIDTSADKVTEERLAG